MAQAMNFDTPVVMDKKAYAVSVKGLIAHALDILFSVKKTPSYCDVKDLPVHLQKDIGVYR
ncbi:hypothetical protein ABT56_19565 [Photobacterium aquae]|uniref:Uncharacterized protein n=1 Tax=Photobacterium aquae TaxID=1195763 RepID=A0A0J1GUD2_9GAMM|nr:hypothetical protein [Photobacterium aquae]KLV03328.1 hypothetical protein ABT56_19565 [Photobacterium aquae]